MLALLYPAYLHAGFLLFYTVSSLIALECQNHEIQTDFTYHFYGNLHITGL